jgi:hypothetical protein
LVAKRLAPTEGKRDLVKHDAEVAPSAAIQPQAEREIHSLETEGMGNVLDEEAGARVKAVDFCAEKCEGTRTKVVG